MAQAKVVTGATGSVASQDVDLAGLGEKTRRRLLRAAVLRYQGNQRQGTHSTKTRAEVARTGRRPFRQKGTGRARAGDFKSPIWKGGGVVFGPRPRSYRSSMTVKARREALRSALLDRFQCDAVALVKDLGLSAPSTKAAAGLLKNLDMSASTLVVLPEAHEATYKSFRNLPRVDVVLAQNVNALDVMQRQNLILVDQALEVIQGRLGDAKEVANAD